MRQKPLIAVIGAVLAATQFLPIRAAHGLNLGQAAPSADGKIYVHEYPNGDAPIGTGTCPPSTWTEADIGDGSGEVCDTTGEWVFAVSGTTFRQNAHLVYKDAGAADVQFEATVADDYSAVTGSNAGLGIGLRETALVDSFIFQIHVQNTGTNIVECTFGAAGTYTTIDGPVGLLRPQDLGATYDVSSGDLKGFAGGLEVCATNRAMSDVLAYAVGQSKSITETLTATLQAPTLGTTIDLYTPSDPPSGSPPVLVSAIPNQEGTQGEAYSFDFRSYFTGAVSHSVDAFPGSSGLSESSDGIISGTPNANDASFSADLCATNADGTTCDVVQFTFTPASGSGSVFTVPDVADVKSTFDCSITGGANGSTWTSVRTSGSNTRPQAGDTILITSGSRGAVEFKNCHGSASSPILYAKTSSATRLTITGTGGANDALLFRDSTYGTLDGLVNWTGHTSGCGSDSTLSETPLTDCGILIDASNQHALKWRGQAFGWTVRGIEIDGNWDGGVNNSGADVGISPNDQNYCVSSAPSLYNREFREDFLLEDFYLHDIAHEAMYFGPNVNFGNCGAGETPPRLRDIHMRDFFIARAGWDGINLKSAIAGTNIIERGVIIDIGGGTAASGANSVGIALFEGGGTVRYNKIRRTSDPPGGANGIHAILNNAPAEWGTMPVEFYGNDIGDTDGHGLSVGDSSAANYTVQIYSNTVVNAGGRAVNVTSGVTGGGVVRENLSTDTYSVVPANVTGNDGTTCALADCGFQNGAGGDFRLTVGSPSRNAAAVCPSIDIRGTSRPQEGACDRGAYEYAP